MADEYGELLIRVRPWDATIDAYPVEAGLDDGSFFAGGRLRLDRQALLRAETDPQAYGLELFYALFDGPIRRAYDKATGRAEVLTGGRLRVRLWIDQEAAELHAIPWERLYHLHRGQPVPLAASILTPFSRYVGLEIPEPEPLAERPIRLLIAIASPQDLPPGLSPIPVEREVENLHQALGNLRRAEQVQVTLMPGWRGLPAPLRTQLEEEGYRILDGPTGLDQIVRHLPHCHAFHFLGHGFFRREGERGEGTAYLVLEDEEGKAVVVGDEEVVTHLAGLDPLPRLVFLSACETARREPEAEHPFVGLGPKVVGAGVPAVVAMQAVVPMEAARRLEGAFYGYLLEHGVVDQALNQARLLLFEGEVTDWAVPVLFMRLQQGQLFTADPVRLTLQAIRAHTPYHPWPEEEYLPLEAVHVVGRQDSGSLVQVREGLAPARDLVDAVLTLFASRRQEAHRRAPVVALIGDHGMAKSTHMRRLAWITAGRSLAPDAERLVVPLYVDLQGYPNARTGLGNPVETLMRESLQPFWPEPLTPTAFAEMLDRSTGPTFRVLLDGSDDLPDRMRREAWRAIRRLVHRYPRHEYVVAVDPDCFDPRRLNPTDLLIIQPLSQRKVEQFLKGLNDPVGLRLYRALDRAQLFDLASIPWLLVRMLDRAREGEYPRSRTAVLQNLVEEAIADVPVEHGMRARAERTLYALAWEMQTARCSTWSVSDAFRTMAAVRGNREYSLEDLYDALVACGLLTRVGQEAMRFTYPAFQAYGCAQALLTMEDRDRVLDDITATLGRLTRLRWWEDALVLLSGLMRKPNVLIRQILYGAALTEGEQPFLAVRCILESGEQRVDADLIAQVVDALVWRLDSANEHRVARRIRAAQVLGQLGHPSAIPYLARVANRRVRLNWRGEPDYDVSSVRLAAALSLRRMMPRAMKQIRDADARLADLLHLWEQGNVGALADLLRSGEVGLQALAAFALGDLQTSEAVEHLVETFLDPETEAQTRWAVTDALALLDPALVTRRAILPLLDAQVARQQGLPARTWRNRAAWYERLAYLIGKIRAQEPAALAFLERCLFEFKGVRLKGKAIQSLGWLYDRRYKALFEEIAIGDFGKIALRPRLSRWERTYLRRKAIEALAYIGDRETLTRLRAGRTGWNPELERAFYWTSEEIYWREG